MRIIQFIAVISIVRQISCMEVTLPLSWCKASDIKVSTTTLTIYQPDGYNQFCVLYKYESLNSLIIKVNYKTIELYKSHIPPLSHYKRYIYHIEGENFEIVVVTLGQELGFIEAGYYIIDNKVYDIWSLGEVINDELQYYHQSYKKLVESAVYSRLPDMRYMHTFDIESAQNGEIIFQKNEPVHIITNMSIETIVCIIMNRALVGQVNYEEEEETEEKILEYNQIEPLDYSVKKNN